MAESENNGPSFADMFNSAVSAPVNMALDRPVWGVGAGGLAGATGGVVLDKLLRKFEDSDEEADYSTPEELRRRAIRRMALVGAGILAGGAGTALAMGDRSGFSEGIGPGASQLFRSLVNKNWRAGSPEAHLAQISSPEAAPLAARELPGIQTPLYKEVTGSMADPETEAFEKLASTLYFNNTIPMAQAMATMAADPHMSDAAKVGMAGMFAQTASQSGSSVFSGADLARTAVRAGAGALEGYALGKVMGTLFALPDRQISTLSRTGAIADAVYSSGIFS